MNEGQAVNLWDTFETITCFKCGITFAVPASVRRRWLDSGDSFYCPNGHSQHYTESTVEKQKKEIERLRKEKEWAEQAKYNALDQADHAERRASAMKGVNTKIKKRIGNGVCPCCNRTFKNLASHMETKHPKYKGK